jgi:FtsZ-binding cell division protein ZapB
MVISQGTTQIEREKEKTALQNPRGNIREMRDELMRKVKTHCRLRRSWNERALSLDDRCALFTFLLW